MESNKRLLPKDALNHDWFFNSFTSDDTIDYKIQAQKNLIKNKRKLTKVNIQSLMSLK